MTLTVKKLVCLIMSVIMATTLMIPLSAFAVDPSVDYANGNGDPTTKLTLIVSDDNLAYNGGDDLDTDGDDSTYSAKSLAKVQVPVAITFVAQSNGDIVGPSNGQAQLRNFAKFPVQVSNIKAVSDNPVTLVSSLVEADGADEIYLQMKPNTGTVLSLGDYTASATETTSGLANGTGKRPTAAAEWNIEGVQSDANTGEPDPSVLNLNDLGGHIGSFGTIDPLAKTEIGRIEWTIKPGRAVSDNNDNSNNTRFTVTSMEAEAAAETLMRYSIDYPERPALGGTLTPTDISKYALYDSNDNIVGASYSLSSSATNPESTRHINTILTFDQFDSTNEVTHVRLQAENFANDPGEFTAENVSLTNGQSDSATLAELGLDDYMSSNNNTIAGPVACTALTTDLVSSVVSLLDGTEADDAGPNYTEDVSWGMVHFFDAGSNSAALLCEINGPGFLSDSQTLSNLLAEHLADLVAAGRSGDITYQIIAPESVLREHYPSLTIGQLNTFLRGLLPQDGFTETDSYINLSFDLDDEDLFADSIAPIMDEEYFYPFVQEFERGKTQAELEAEAEAARQAELAKQAERTTGLVPMTVEEAQAEIRKWNFQSTYNGSTMSNYLYVNELEATAPIYDKVTGEQIGIHANTYDSVQHTAEVIIDVMEDGSVPHMRFELNPGYKESLDDTQFTLINTYTGDTFDCNELFEGAIGTSDLRCLIGTFPTNSVPYSRLASALRVLCPTEVESTSYYYGDSCWNLDTSWGWCATFKDANGRDITTEVYIQGPGFFEDTQTFGQIADFVGSIQNPSNNSHAFHFYIGDNVIDDYYSTNTLGDIHDMMVNLQGQSYKYNPGVASDPTEYEKGLKQGKLEWGATYGHGPLSWYCGVRAKS